MYPDVNKRKFLIIICVAIGAVILSIVMMIIKTVSINNYVGNKASDDDDYQNTGIVEYVDEDDFEVPSLDRIIGVWGCNDDSKMIQIDGAGNFIDLTESNSRKYLYDSADGYLNVSGGTGPNLEYMLSTNGALLRMTDSATYAILNCYIRENYEE